MKWLIFVLMTKVLPKVIVLDLFVVDTGIFFRVYGVNGRSLNGFQTIPEHRHTETRGKNSDKRFMNQILFVDPKRLDPKKFNF